MRLVGLLLISFLHFASFAQQYEYVPFASVGARWSIDIHNGMNCGQPPGFCYHTYNSIASDTVYQDTIFAVVTENSSTQNVFGYVRDDLNERKVFYRQQLSGAEELLYDFGVEVGDTVNPTVQFFGGDSYVIASIDTVVVGTTLRRKLNLLLTGSSNETYWLEGIGSNRGPFLPPPVFENWSFLRCYHLLDELLYSNPIDMPLNYLLQAYPDYQHCDPTLVGIQSTGKTKLSVFPNPTNNIINIDLGDYHVDFTVVLTDILGKPILSETNQKSIDLTPVPSGYYILTVQLTSGNRESFKVLRTNE